MPEERIGAEEDITRTLLYFALRAGAYNNGNVYVLDGSLVLTGYPCTDHKN